MHRGGRVRDAARGILPTAAATLAVLAALGCGEREAPAVDTSRPAVAAKCAQDAPPVVTPGGVGVVKLGEPVTAAECPTRDTTWMASEGVRERGAAVTIGGGILVLLSDSASGRLTRIITTDRAFRTERGIGVGSTVGDLRRAHGRVCLTLGEGEVVVSAAQLPGLSFATTADYGSVARIGADLEAAAVPDSARITRMWIFDGESLCGAS